MDEMRTMRIVGMVQADRQLEERAAYMLVCLQKLQIEVSSGLRLDRDPLSGDEGGQDGRR